jgi:ketosteroid isomerase-like protein
MAGELETVVRDMFEGIDRKDFDAVMRVIDEEVQGIDETGRRWLRGRNDVVGHWRQGLMLTEDVHTELRDVWEGIIGDAGIFTCWLEQDYTQEGKAQHVSGPATIVFRRLDDNWKTVLFHSIPLPEDEVHQGASDNR